MSGQQCGLAGSTLLSQADVFIWFVPYFIPLLLFYIVPPKSSIQIAFSNNGSSCVQPTEVKVLFFHCFS